MGPRGLAMGQRCFGAALTGLCRGAAAVLGLPGFPRAHAMIFGVVVAMGPLLRGRGDPHSVLASPHNRLEARLTASAPAWTWLLIGSLLVASHPWLRPPWSRALRALARLAVGLGLSRAGHALGHALEAATGSCRSATPLGTLLLPLSDPAQCRGAGHTWEGFGPAPQAFALVHCGLGLAEEAAALGRSLYGRGKMAAGSKMAAGFKMAAGYGSEEESKMAARYGPGEESKMAARFKMAPGYGSEEESKMASRYGLEEESKMAARSKMAAGYGLGEEAKMAAGSGWGWPRPIWRPEWAGPPRYGWGGHFEHPGGHFDGRRSPYGAGHFESGSGGHLEGRSGGHLECRGGHFEHYGGHFERRGGHLESHHLEGGHFERRGGHLEPPTHHPHRHGGHFEHHGGHFEHRGGHFEHRGGHLGSISGHFEHGGGHFDGVSGHFDQRGGHFEGAGGHFEREAPPLALSLLYLLALALLLTWHLLLVATLTYRHTWARNAAGAALGWAAWALTYRGWYRWAWSPGPPGWG